MDNSLRNDSGRLGLPGRACALLQYGHSLWLIEQAEHHPTKQVTYIKIDPSNSYVHFLYIHTNMYVCMYVCIYIDYQVLSCLC